METFSPEQNAKKYGDNRSDLIAQHFDMSLELGIIFCAGNIARYSRRFDSEAEKAHNPADKQKMLDYVNRAIDKANETKNDYYFLLLIDIKSLIERNENCVKECLFLESKCLKYAK